MAGAEKEAAGSISDNERSGGANRTSGPEVGASDEEGAGKDIARRAIEAVLADVVDSVVEDARADDSGPRDQGQASTDRAEAGHVEDRHDSSSGDAGPQAQDEGEKQEAQQEQADDADLCTSNSVESESEPAAAGVADSIGPALSMPSEEFSGDNAHTREVDSPSSVDAYAPSGHNNHHGAIVGPAHQRALAGAAQLLLRSLRLIAAAPRRWNRTLVAAAETALERSTNLGESDELVTLLTDDDFLNDALHALSLACAGRNLKLAMAALEGLQRMLLLGVLDSDVLAGGEQLLSALKAAEAAAKNNEGTTQLAVLATIVTAVACTRTVAHSSVLEQCVSMSFDLAAHSKREPTRRAGRAVLDFAIRVAVGRAEGASAFAPPAGTAAGIATAIGSNDAAGTLGTAAQLVTLAPLMDARSGSPQDTQIFVTRALEDVAAVQREAERVWREDLAARVATPPQPGVASTELPSPQQLPPGGGAFVADVVSVMKALCTTSAQAPDIDQEAKTVSLEGLVQILRLASPLLCSDLAFVEAVRQHLCSTLLANCASRHARVYELAAQVLQELFINMRSELKKECGVFYPTIFLRPLEAVSSAKTTAVPDSHALVALESVMHIMRDPQALVDLYANFDCDVGQPDLFADSINAIASMTRALHSPSSRDLRDPAKAMRISSACHVAHECLVDTIKAISEWTRMFHADTEASGQRAAESSPSQTPSEASDTPDSTGGGVSRRSSLIDPASKIGVDRGVQLFNEKPSKGIRLLIDGGLIEDDPEAVASLLRVANGLDPRAIGEYLGDRAPFNVEVLDAFVASVDFAAMPFSAALRHFLSLFRLPGEAQKIDRIMERFAAHFVEDNPDGVLQNADTAYVLAYSAIMLHTDAHNPSVTKKMTQEAFVLNNRGIDDGEDLPRDFLLEQYDDIVSNEISLHEDPPEGTSTGAHSVGSLGGLGVIFSVLNAQRMRTLALDEEEARARERASMALVRRAADTASEFAAARGRTLAEPMMLVAWPAFLAAFSVALEGTADDDVSADYALEGLAECIHVACALGMDKERDLFVSGLAKFTLLVNQAEMRSKNVRAIHALMRVAVDNGDMLGSSWSSVLTCASRLDHLRTIHDIEIKIAEPDPQHHTMHAVGGSQLSHVNVTQKQAHAAIGWVLGEVDQALVDRVFTLSKQLSASAIVSFVDCLSRVSTDELMSSTEPRLFSLRKIVEVADHNIERIRLTWTRLWRILSAHFEKACCHAVMDVALFAVDSLRQLASKFLEQDSLGGSDAFQRDFLSPFVNVFERSRTKEVRELVIRCCSQLALGHVGELRAGWRSMFAIFEAAAVDSEKFIVSLAFQTIEKVVREHFARISDAHAFGFLVSCLGAYAAQDKDPNVSLNAIAFLRYCALEVAEGGVPDDDMGDHSRVEQLRQPLSPPRHRQRHRRSASLSSPVTPVSSGASTLSSRELDVTRDEKLFWYPLLRTLSVLTLDERMEVAHASSEVTGDILDFHGSQFSLPFWMRAMRRVLIPMCCGIADASDWKGAATVRVTTDLEWINTMCMHTLEILVSVFAKNYEALHVALLSDVAGFLGALVRYKESPAVETVPVMALGAMLKLVEACAEKMDNEGWATIFYHFTDTLTLLSPNYQDLMNAYDQAVHTPPEIPSAPKQPIVVSAGGGDTPAKRSLTDEAAAGEHIDGDHEASDLKGEESEEDGGPATSSAEDSGTSKSSQPLISPAAYARFMAAVREARRVVAVAMMVVSATTRTLEHAREHGVPFNDMKGVVDDGLARAATRTSAAIATKPRLRGVLAASPIEVPPRPHQRGVSSLLENVLKTEGDCACAVLAVLEKLGAGDGSRPSGSSVTACERRLSSLCVTSLAYFVRALHEYEAASVEDDGAFAVAPGLTTMQSWALECSARESGACCALRAAARMRARTLGRAMPDLWPCLATLARAGSSRVSELVSALLGERTALAAGASGEPLAMQILGE